MNKTTFNPTVGIVIRGGELNFGQTVDILNVSPVGYVVQAHGSNINCSIPKNHVQLYDTAYDYTTTPCVINPIYTDNEN